MNLVALSNKMLRLLSRFYMSLNEKILPKFNQILTYKIL